MNDRALSWTLLALFGCGLAVRPPAAAESAAVAVPAALRQADAALAAAADAANADAWVAFYDAGIVARLPHEPLADGKEAARRAVARLLARPISAVQWTPTRTILSRSGRLAYRYGRYALHFSDAQTTMRGERVEIWREGGDHRWRCIVDLWNPATGAQVAPSALGAVAASPATAAAQPSPAVTPAGPWDAKYGARPVHYEAAIRRYFAEHLKDPASVVYRRITPPTKGYTTAIAGTFLMRDKRFYGWKVEATVDAKDARGQYSGDQTYAFLFRGETIVRVVAPLPMG